MQIIKLFLVVLIVLVFVSCGRSSSLFSDELKLEVEVLNRSVINNRIEFDAVIILTSERTGYYTFAKPVDKFIMISLSNGRYSSYAELKSIASIEVEELMRSEPRKFNFKFHIDLDRKTIVFPEPNIEHKLLNDSFSFRVYLPYIPVKETDIYLSDGDLVSNVVTVQI